MSTGLTLGEYIRRKRKERLLSLGDLAQRVGVSYGYMSKIENDRLTPSLRALTRIGHALSEPVARLVNLSKYSSLPVDQGAGNPPEVLAMAKTRPTEPPYRHKVEPIIEDLLHRLGPGETVHLLEFVRDTWAADRGLLEDFVQFSYRLNPEQREQAFRYARCVTVLDLEERQALTRYIEQRATASTKKESKC